MGARRGVVLFALLVQLVGCATARKTDTLRGKWSSEPWRITSYCTCKKCCGKWADGMTATGVPAKGRIVAVDPAVVPLHSRVEIEGLGTFRAEDTGSSIRGRRIDVLMPTHQSARRFGVKWRRVRIVSTP